MARILVIEDDATNLQMVVRLLKREGHTAITAENGRDGVSLAISERPDLVLMDIGLPDDKGGKFDPYGGLKATRAIRAAPETATVPIIAVTAHGITEDREKMFAAGCDDIALKPFEFKALIQQINKACAPREAKDASSNAAGQEQ